METYTILVKGRIQPDWDICFEGLRIKPQPDGTTLLTGPVRDQSDLFGHLRRLERLGITLISLNRSQP